MKRTRLLFADQQSLFTEALTKVLEPEFEVVGTVADGLTFVETAVQTRPNVSIIETSLPRLNGLEAGAEVLKRVPDAKLMYLTMNQDEEVLAEAWRIGAHGYVLKNCSTSDLLSAIRLVIQGCIYVAPTIDPELISSLHRIDNSNRVSSQLTERQREVLGLLADGRTMKEVAFELNIKPRTVAYHKYRMMADFNLNSTADLVKFAVKKEVA